MAITTVGSRAVWTREDEAKLQELQERKARIMSENRERLYRLLDSHAFGTGDDTGELVARIIPIASELREALLPFVEEGDTR